MCDQYAGNFSEGVLFLSLMHVLCFFVIYHCIMQYYHICPCYVTAGSHTHDWGFQKSLQTLQHLANKYPLLWSLQRFYDFVWEGLCAVFSTWCSLCTRCCAWFYLYLEFIWVLFSTLHLLNNIDLQFEWTLSHFPWVTCIHIHVTTLKRLGNYNAMCLRNASFINQTWCVLWTSVL